MTATHISIYGEVHRVGFRAWAKEQAKKDNLSGWVRKAADGSIEVFLQGEEDGINNFSFALLGRSKNGLRRRCPCSRS